MPIGPARMPLLDHIGELRRRLVVIVVCVLVATVIFYMLAPQLVEFLEQPIAQYLPEDGTLIVIGAFEGFSVKLRVALFAGVVAASPVIFWQLLAFFLPALKPKERHYVLPTFAVAVFLFALGMVFCYMFCLGPAFQWLTGEGYSVGDVMPQASDYLHYVELFLLAFGIAFQLPLVIFYLILFDIVPYKKLRHSWRIVYIVLMVVAAVVTPDASPITMIIMFAALVALYEVALAAARIALNKKIARQKQEEGAALEQQQQPQQVAASA